MKIALASAPVRDRDIEFNKSTIIKIMIACRNQADLVVFGESMLQGFNCLDWCYLADRNMAVSADGKEIKEIAQAAKSNAIAVSFGYIEKYDDTLYSSQIVIDDSGRTIYNYRRVSMGWKDNRLTDAHYKEGEHFDVFPFKGKRLSIALCGDLWTDGKTEELKSLGADIVLWPVYCDFTPEAWNESVKFEYAQQAALCGGTVLYVNSFCIDPMAPDCSSGGAALLEMGRIPVEIPAGVAGVLVVDV